MMKKGLLLAVLAAGAAQASAAAACDKLVGDGMTLTAYTAQCAAFGDEARYRRFVKASANNFGQIGKQNCQEATAKGKDGLPHPLRAFWARRERSAARTCLSFALPTAVKPSNCFKNTAVELNLLKFLQAQGFGSRKACRWLLRGGLVCVNGEMCRDETADASAVRELAIDGETQWLIPQPFFYLLMNKPAGYEVSQRPRDYPSVFALLPERVRAVGVQAVGRLDADTTGVLLFTNDGAFNHRMTSPKQHVAKHYRATLKHPAAPDLCANLVRGVLLHDDEETVSARSAETQTRTR